MPPISIPGDVIIEYTTKKIHLIGPADYKVVDPGTGAVLEDIHLGPGGEYDGKVADISIKARVLSSKMLSGVINKAITGAIASPTIEVVMEIPQGIVESPATRFVMEISDRYTNVHVPVAAYGRKTSFKFVKGEAASVSALASPRSEHLWVGFRVRGIDYRLFAKYYHPADVYFTVSAEQINGRHKKFGDQSRASIALLDGEDGTPLLTYISELTSVQWCHVVRERPPVISTARSSSHISREKIILLLEELLNRGTEEGTEPTEEEC